MRAFALHGDELVLGLADVDATVEPAVRDLAFERRGALYVRTFAGDAPYAAEAGARFEEEAEHMVAQAARLEPVPWEDALELVLSRRAQGWSLAGSAALAARGADVAPRDIDLISSADGCDELAHALADVLVEPLVDGGRLGERWFRAFGPARIECVGGIKIGDARYDTIEWRGRELSVAELPGRT